MIEGMDDSDGEIETSNNNEMQNNSVSKVSNLKARLNKYRDKIRVLENQTQIFIMNNRHQKDQLCFGINNVDSTLGVN